MKKILALAGIVVLFVACSEKSEKKDTNAKVETRDSKGLKIAYYDQDSLKTQFEFYKEQDSIVTKKQLTFQNELEKRSRELQDYIARNNQRANSGLLAPNEIAQIQQEAQRKEAALMNYQQTEGQKLEKETFDKLEAIGKKIEFFGKQYCEENKIDILLVYAKGGQFNFINPSMDVTREFTAYLNEHQTEIENDIAK